jgi:hypothetical protein
MLAVFPTAYFGSILYFKEMAKNNAILIEAKEHFPKQSYRNRCDILSADGILSLSIPVKKEQGSKTHTDDVRLANAENWRSRHWRAIKTAYQSAPYFDYYGREVYDLLFSEEDRLLDLNDKITAAILDWLDIPVELKRTESFHPILNDDPRINLVDKNRNTALIEAPYIQVFPSLEGFTMNMSILDAIMCEGPLARNLVIPK